MKIGNCQLKKTAWKAGKIFFYGGLGAIISWLSGIPATPTITLTISILVAAENFLKNYK